MTPTLPPAAVLFDMDGVIVDTFDAWVAVLDECRTRRGMTPLGPGPVREYWGQGLHADCVNFFPGETPDVLAREYSDGFARHIARVRPEPGAQEAVRRLARAGVALALVTNSPLAMARRILDLVALRAEFGVIAGGDEVAMGKPAPDLLHLATRRLGTPADRAVMVGDTQLDVDAARRVPMFVVGYRLDGDARIERMHDLPAVLGLGDAGRS